MIPIRLLLLPIFFAAVFMNWLWPDRLGGLTASCSFATAVVKVALIGASIKRTKGRRGCGL
ncbi:hypothetical protein RA28_11315 [Ruegeria sp. ANG-S4]|nr:hypothetical protein RA28_11315 [Ruegeria sp. ANG-S4]